MGNWSVLIVDDQPFLRNLLKEIVLTTWPGAEFTLAADGLEALENLKEKAYDVLFMDIEMPKMTGIELLTEVKKNSLASDSTIVMCTGCKGESKPVEAMGLGADYFVRKPFEMHEIGLILDEIRWEESGALSHSF